MAYIACNGIKLPLKYCLFTECIASELVLNSKRKSIANKGSKLLNMRMQEVCMPI